MSKLIDRKNLLMIFLGVGLYIFFGFILPDAQLKNKQVEQKAPSVAPVAEVKVIYTEQGFEPATVTVKVGTTVSWENKSSKPMWVGSDPHPKHTDLPGFDQKGIINKLRFVPQVMAHGEGVYEYTFTKPGTWKYHNHIIPQDRGVIIVEK